MVVREAGGSSIIGPGVSGKDARRHCGGCQGEEATAAAAAAAAAAAIL